MLLHFLQTLHDTGRAELALKDRDVVLAIRQAGQGPVEKQQIEALLKTWYQQAIMDFPGIKLAYDPETAFWGAVLSFRATCLISFRDIEVEQLHELLTHPPMPNDSESTFHFSADLCLRHWPGLYRMARARSEDDPLVKIMESLALCFPVSALGMNLALPDNHCIVSHEGLLQFYAERALERNDQAAMTSPAVATFIHKKLGAYPSVLSRGLFTY